MPYQIKNGIIYSGNAVTLTQAQYDALTEAEKKNGTVYYISDSSAVMDASDVGIDGGGNLQDIVGSVATIESSPATATHAVGDYIVYNGQLYKVTSAISVGQTLTPGTNISATTAGAELTSLNTGLRTFTSVSAVGDRATGVSGGYAYLNDHTVLVQIIGTMNLNTNNAYEFALLQGLPIPWINAALSLNILSVGSLSGFASTARVGTDGAITVSLSKSADNVYGKAFCLCGIYYVN